MQIEEFERDVETVSKTSWQDAYTVCQQEFFCSCSVRYHCIIMVYYYSVKKEKKRKKKEYTLGSSLLVPCKEAVLVNLHQDTLNKGLGSGLLSLVGRLSSSSQLYKL